MARAFAQGVEPTIVVPDDPTPASILSWQHAAAHVVLPALTRWRQLAFTHGRRKQRGPL
jgi:hypothetical protein